MKLEMFSYCQFLPSLDKTKLEQLSSLNLLNFSNKISGMVFLTFNNLGQSKMQAVQPDKQ